MSDKDSKQPAQPVTEKTADRGEQKNEQRIDYIHGTDSAPDPPPDPPPIKLLGKLKQGDEK